MRQRWQQRRRGVHSSGGFGNEPGPRVFFCEGRDRREGELFFGTYFSWNFFGHRGHDDDDDGGYGNGYWHEDDDIKEDGNNNRKLCSEELVREARNLLGVSPGASVKEIRASYRRMALRYHLDKYKGPEEVDGMTRDEAEERFKVLSNAHSYLMEKTQT